MGSRKPVKSLGSEGSTKKRGRATRPVACSGDAGHRRAGARGGQARRWPASPLRPTWDQASCLAPERWWNPETPLILMTTLRFWGRLAPVTMRVLEFFEPTTFLTVNTSITTVHLFLRKNRCVVD